MLTTAQSDLPVNEPGNRSVGEWLDNVNAAMARGELIEAYDLSERALADFPEDLELRYKAVLILGRSGATGRARFLYNNFNLGNAIRGRINSALEIDIAALDARIAKDEALAAAGSSRKRLLAAAAARYERIFRHTRDSYPGINAATLWLLCRNFARSKPLARQVIKLCASARPATGLSSYFVRATEAEAALILGDLDLVRKSLADAALNFDNDLSALATTRRQLRLICDALDIPVNSLGLLSSPAVIHYAGHMIGPRFVAAEQERVRQSIVDSMERLNVGFGYGSLSGGADILCAEALLGRGAELNVVFPVVSEEFKQISVAPSGKSWLKRFEMCMRRAKTVTFATADEYARDDSVFVYADRLAMGQAVLRAKFLDTAVHQIAVWDGQPPHSRNSAGTAASISFWQKRNLPTEVINPCLQGHRAVRGKVDSVVKRRTDGRRGRTIRAILFCDVKGFSKLHEAQLLVFEREILGRFARVIARHRRQILFRNTWGDGLHVIASDVEAAARCAIDLLEEVASFNPLKHGLPEFMGLRLGGHLGPVFRLRDPVMKRWNFVGSQVNPAAMIEPVTPVGAAYVTEAFAAALAMNPASGFDCEYVGQVRAAKLYGTMRMYSLRRNSD